MPIHFTPPEHHPVWPGHVNDYRMEQIAALQAQIAALEAIQPPTVTTTTQIAALQAQVAALELV